MISGVFGLPGAGKTTFLTWCARRALAYKPLFVGHLWGRVYLTEFRSYERVFTTFPVDGCYRFDYESTVGTFQYENSLILIDEMSHLQDNRDYKTYDKGKKYFFSMLRHFHCDLIYCSQSYMDCDKKIQNMTSSLFLIEKRANHRSRISPVLPEQLIQKHDITVGYSLAPWISRTTLNRKRLYEHFDSFAFDRLPPVPAIPWALQRQEDIHPSMLGGSAAPPVGGAVPNNSAAMDDMTVSYRGIRSRRSGGSPRIELAPLQDSAPDT